MKIFGLATLMAVETLEVEGVADGVKAELLADRLDEGGEQGEGGDDGRADGEALGHGLGGVAHGVKAGHDALRLAGELSAHLGDTGGVVGHGAVGVLGDDRGRGGQQPDAD